MPSRVHAYSAHIDRLVGDAEPEVFVAPSTRHDVPGVTALRFAGLPRRGMATSITYGVSLVRHRSWEHGTAELCMCVRSSDAIWSRVLGYLGEQLRGVCPFTYGNTIDFGERIASDTRMTAFFVHASTVIEREDAIGIDVSEPSLSGTDLITIQGMYPIHEIERQFINERGLDAFWNQVWDTYDVSRPPAV
ncbi:MAG TPA: suppressor of fused domain protein [Yinghuangia sp.]|uniref:suppressor of fused domain protein n=1 Tax=Yinghuangia sp. YIM S10712 TaxID=3436930 RepID=UPI002C247CC9|nr:suppressor of fused domain protein [Yinghuangia sp.]